MLTGAPGRFALMISFCGTPFSGWQRQARRPSVQQCLEEAASSVFRHDVRVRGCGRTDAGVHALAYVADFEATTRMTPAEVVRALNSHLPPEIRVKMAWRAKPGFHSRFSARSKTYRYLIADRRTPFLLNAALFVPPPLDMPAMKQAARYLTGRHDFSAFCAAGSSVKDRIRTVMRISFSRHRFILDPSVHLLAIEIEADGFLYKMARNIAATLIAVGRGRIPPGRIPEILAAGNRTAVPPTAPAYALYLKEVNY